MSTALLHQWKISPFCAKVRRILELKNIPYETREYNGIRAPLAARLSKVGKLPVLDINGNRIADSRKIAAYLESAYPDVPLVPRDPALRASMEIMQDWADESLYWYNFYFRLKYDTAWEKVATSFSEGRPAHERLIVNTIGRRQYLRQLHAQGIGRIEKEQVEARFLLLINQLNETLSHHAWLVGETRTLADIAVAAQLNEVRRTSHLNGEIANRTALALWLDKV